MYPDATPADDTDNPRKHYLFEDARFPNALTGIINENGVRYASWEYDAYGRAISSTHNGGIDKYEFEYIDGNTTLVRKYVSDTEYHETVKKHDRYNGSEVVTAVSNSPCTDCIVGDVLKVFDPETGNLMSKTNEKGVVTTYQYDSNHHQILRVEAAGTPQERVVETQWDDAFNKPLRIIEGGQITEYAYDASSKVTSKTVRVVE
jgi:YD repeat-containing protein